MEEKKGFLTSFSRSYKSLPDKKRYIEFVTALLSVPVLLTVLFLNVSSLKKTEGSEKLQAKQIVVTVPVEKTTAKESEKEKELPPSPTVTPTEECKKEIGPIDITNPQEGDTVSENPITISINSTKGNFCAVVWSYRINYCRWSDYDDKSIALYNPPKGDIVFSLRVKSVVTGEEKVLTRSFTYSGNADEATPSATVTPN